MGSGASKKSNEDAQAKSDEESDDFETYTQKKAEANGQPKLEQAGLLPKLEQPTSTTNFKKPTVGAICTTDIPPARAAKSPQT